MDDTLEAGHFEVDREDPLPQGNLGLQGRAIFTTPACNREARKSDATRVSVVPQRGQKRSPFGQIRASNHSVAAFSYFESPLGGAVEYWPHRKRLSVTAAAFNTGMERARVDTPAPLYDEGASPLGIGHVVFLAADIEAGEKFYRDRLGFRLSDRYSGNRAVFLRCSAENEHHNLFFLNTSGAKTELQHVAFQVRDIHEVFGGGVRMRELGYKTEVGPGRHPVSSAYFWYFESPLGGAVEYYADSDYATEAWKPRTFEGLRFSQWHVQDGVGPAVGGRVKEERPAS